MRRVNQDNDNCSSGTEFVEELSAGQHRKSTSPWRFGATRPDNNGGRIVVDNPSTRSTGSCSQMQIATGYDLVRPSLLVSASRSTPVMKSNDSPCYNGKGRSSVGRAAPPILGISHLCIRLNDDVGQYRQTGNRNSTKFL